ncbi:hypothetical protein CDL12_05863 [Handroanthus impetiginosus]|uniref:Uncharacterized protein n=1 Tax=Handroanthus impetiginosus TaxID=429701 RepID=A0A2G9HV93_9LAMI|nr:hypothetical protein CDL12_05863 [Handroanthus impetiginosus]
MGLPKIWKKAYGQISFSFFPWNRTVKNLKENKEISPLTVAYRAFYILNWIYRYFTEEHFIRWISCVSGVVQTALYADFFYYYFISWKNNAKLKLPA